MRMYMNSNEGGVVSVKELNLGRQHKDTSH